MWKTRTWSLSHKAEYERWIEANSSRFQIEIIFVNNGYGVTYRPLRML